MTFTKSLRVKVLLSVLIPMAFGLVVVAVTTLNVYERRARVVVEQRDTELAKITAARLSEGLAQHTGILETLAADNNVQSMEPARLGPALERVQDRLFVFDAGVVVYDSERIAVWSDPFAFERRGKIFPVPSEFDKVRSTLSPHFSDVFRDSHSGENAILLGVPIVASGGEFKGVLAGMSTLEALQSDATYAPVLKITAGREGFAYLVDGRGRVIFHTDSSQLARDLSSIAPVTRAIGGEASAFIIEGPDNGETVISGFAPLPDMSWVVVTQERWDNVIGPIRRTSMMLLSVLVVGGVLSSILVFVAIGRALKPVRDLILGAQRIAGGDFDYPIACQASQNGNPG